MTKYEVISTSWIDRLRNGEKAKVNHIHTVHTRGFAERIVQTKKVLELRMYSSLVNNYEILETA